MIYYTWGNAEQTALVRSDGLNIPMDENNRHYKQFLESGSGVYPYVAPPAPADYIGFGEALLTSPTYGLIRETAKVSLPVNVLATELLGLLGDAKAGRPNEAAIQNSLTELDATVPFAAENRTEFNGLFATHNLPFTL